ncbi:MAG: ABC transporter ATP-binding protein [Solirubrobacteraceae bacterium]
MATPTVAMALRAEHLTKTFGEGPTSVRALRGVDLGVAEGEFVAIMGPSGSGKSTLLHILGGLDRPTAGRLEIEGRRYDELADRELTELRGRTFGFVFQFFNLMPTLTAAENVLLPALVAGERPAAYAARADELLALVGLTGRAGHLPSELSGGEQQRVAIARALLRAPGVLLADEPTGNLDSTSGAIVLGLLRRLVDDGQTVVMVTHDAGAAALADRVVFLRDGEIVSELDGGDAGRIGEELRDLTAPRVAGRAET